MRFDCPTMEGRDEVVVRTEERDDRRRDREQRTADRGRGHDNEQEQQQHRRQGELVAEMRQPERQQRQTHRRERQPGQSPPGVERRAPPEEAPAYAEPMQLAASSLCEITCRSIGPDRRMTRLITDPRIELGPTRAPARTEHELRAVLDPRQLCERGRNVGRDHLVIFAAEVGQQLAVPFDRLEPPSAHEPFVVAHVHSEKLTVRALRHPRGAADQRFGSRRAGDRDEHALARSTAR